MFVLTIILLQTQTNHIISLWKSTKTKQIILQPKAPAKIVEFIFDHRVKDHYSANKNETCNSITAIKKNEPKKLRPKIPAKFLKLISDDVYSDQLCHDWSKHS